MRPGKFDFLLEFLGSPMISDFTETIISCIYLCCYSVLKIIMKMKNTFLSEIFTLIKIHFKHNFMCSYSILLLVVLLLEYHSANTLLINRAKMLFSFSISLFIDAFVLLIRVFKENLVN